MTSREALYNELEQDDWKVGEEGEEASTPPRFLPPVATFVDLKLNFEFILTTYLGMFGSDLVFSHRSFWVMLAPQMF